ncbi:hypothetical protein ACFWV1_26140 [Streptomyces sp. NPDC058700]|uniref:hypothetical protein n=1 Tax=Streptomyces sp. NPDC058700 TaxID=3346607 RepID=UPI003657B7F2
MNDDEFLAGLSELIATPFIPELHEDDCPDVDCSGCVSPEGPAADHVTRPRQQEDPHNGPLATHYETPRDLPSTPTFGSLL